MLVVDVASGTQRKHDYIFEDILDKLYYNLYIHAFLFTLLTLIDYSNVHKNAISHARVRSLRILVQIFRRLVQSRSDWGSTVFRLWG